jgi:hypothetical protein
MTWSLVTYIHNGTAGVAVLREDGTLVAPMDLKRWATMQAVAATLTAMRRMATDPAAARSAVPS